MCAQGRSVVNLCLPALAGRLRIAQVTNKGQVCASVSESVKTPLMRGTTYIAEEVCVRLSACARPALWHSAVSGAEPRPNVQAQASLETAGMTLGCFIASSTSCVVLCCVCVLYWVKQSCLILKKCPELLDFYEVLDVILDRKSVV